MKRKLKFKHGTEFNLNLEWERKNKISITELIDIISNSCSQISIIRFDQSKTQKNLILYLSLSDRTNIEEILDEINTFRSDISAQFYDASIEY